VPQYPPPVIVAPQGGGADMLQDFAKPHDLQPGKFRKLPH
jgi:hypothetical protein